MIQLVVAQDSEAAVDFANREFCQRSESNGSYPFKLVFAEWIRNESIFDECNRLVGEQLSGEVAISIDLGLSIPEIRERLKTALSDGTWQSRPHDTIDLFNGTFEGVFLALSAIDNKRIKRLLIQIETGGMNQYTPHVLNFLMDCANERRRGDCVSIEASTSHLGAAAVRGRPDPKLLVLDELERNWRVGFGDPFERYVDVLKNLSGLQRHPHHVDEAKAVAIKILSSLIDEPEEWFEAEIWQKWIERWGDENTKECVKTLTLERSPALNALSAWFIAAAAYRNVDAYHAWNVNLFKMSDIFDFQLCNKSLTPLGMDLASCLNVSEMFYTLCKELFRPSSGADKEGPLSEVQLDVSKGLVFRLRFDCTDPDGLAVKIARRRNRTVGWSDQIEDGGRTTSKAVWDFWVATSVAARERVVSGSTGVFGDRDMWRMNIFRASASTEVAFHDYR